MPKATTDLTRLTQGGPGPRKRTPRHIGRVSKLSPEISKRICDAIRAGNYESVAARYAGVSPQTLVTWKRKGAEATSRSNIYRTFLEDLDAAEAAAEVSANLHWRAAMPKDWHASERWLQVRYPERYSNTRDTMSQQTAVQVNLGIGSSTQQAEIAQPSQSIARLLEDNPDMIAGAMKVLDQLLPSSNTEISEGDWREVPEIVENAPIELSSDSDD